MKDIVELSVVQIRIYPIDVIPIAVLLLEKSLNSFKENLRFKSGSVAQDKGEIVGLFFQNGEFEHGGTIHLVERLQIEYQRTMLSVFGDSGTADAVYEEVCKIINNVDPDGRFTKAKPYVKTEETSCVVTLDVDFKKLFAPPLLRFLEKTVQHRTATKIAKTEVVPSKFSGRITYQLSDAESRKGNFQLAAKTFTIEPRARTHLKERRYYTQSPTDSDTHFTLLREFEKALKGPTK